jgi:RIO kinase 1
VALDRDAALGVYADLCAQMIAMLCCDLIHGDLSPYNILAAADGPTIIDFPQVVSAVHSSRAEFFFLRDFDNIMQFVVGFDPALRVHRHDGRAIWRAYVNRELTPDFVPPPPPPQQPNGAGRNRRPDERSDPRAERRRGDGNQARPQDRRRSGAPRRADQPLPRDPRSSIVSAQSTATQEPNVPRHPGSDPRPPRERPTGVPHQGHAQSPPADRSRSPHDRDPALQRQHPPSRQPASPASSPASGRRRRRKRYW